jgi:hypothetical protein
VLFQSVFFVHVIDNKQMRYFTSFLEKPAHPEARVMNTEQVRILVYEMLA